MLRRLRVAMAWRVVRNTGAIVYSENRITGERRARTTSQGYQPIDVAWLERRRPAMTPPHQGAA